MPRVSTTIEEEIVEKKTPRKRAAPKKTTTRKTVAKKAAPKKTTTRKTPVKKTAAKKTPAKKTTTKKATKTKEEVIEDIEEFEEVEVAEVEAKISKRKAPTVFADQAAKKKAVRTQAIVMGVLVTMGIGASAAVGFNDSEAGQINVEQTIREQNARMADMVDVDGPTVVAPAPNRATIPDDGLIPSADQSGRQTTVPTQVAGIASSTATSTDSTATTTDDGTELDAENPPENIGQASAVDTATTTVTAIEQQPMTEEEIAEARNFEVISAVGTSSLSTE